MCKSSISLTIVLIDLFLCFFPITKNISQKLHAKGHALEENIAALCLIFNLFGLIPWDPPSFMVIGIWPILMGASMWVQQKLNPAPTDPIQAKIFAFFPLFLTIILASFPSGLVVYWTVNNILTIAQQYVIVKKTTVKTN